MDLKGFSTLRPQPPDPRHYDPVAEVAHCGELLERAFQVAAKRDESFLPRVLRIAYRVDQALDFDRDAVLAAIHQQYAKSYPVHHSLQKAVWAGLLLRLEGESEEVRVGALCAALTANLSILTLQSELETQADPLSEEQRKRLWLHPRLSAEMLRKLGVEDEGWLRAVKQHHERLDGSGYPERLSGEDLDNSALALAFGDELSAMITPRGYRESLPPSEALVQMGQSSGETLPQRFVARSLKSLGVYIPGTPVRLKDGSYALVTRRGASPKTPQICLLINRLQKRLYRPQYIDLSESSAPKLERTLPLDAVTVPMSLSLIYGYV